MTAHANQPTTTLCQVQPWAASHYEGLAREWAHCANALNEVAAERGRDQ